MPLADKTTGMADAVSQIEDGTSVMIGGFGIPGTPFCLIEELVRQGPRNLTIIKNDSNVAGMGVDWLLQSGQVKKLIASHIGMNCNAVRMMNAGEIDVEFSPQGILAERIRAAGAGLLGIVTDIGLGTQLAKGRPRIVVGGVEGLLERALRADFALVHAAVADTFGNLTYDAAARNFSPLMAMAAETTIVEAEKVVPVGQIDPEAVHTPGSFVTHVLELSELPEVYGVHQG